MFARPPAWEDADDTSQLPQIISLVVKGEFRNQGAGTFLIGAVEEEVKSRGLKHVYLAVDQDDPKARRLYDRLGFVVVSNEAYKSTWTYKLWIKTVGHDLCLNEHGILNGVNDGGVGEVFFRKLLVP